MAEQDVDYRVVLPCAMYIGNVYAGNWSLVQDMTNMTPSY